MLFASKFVVGCDPSCSSCSGGSNTQCSSCNTGYFLQPSSTNCSSTCPLGYYGNTTTSTCTLCDPSCTNCTGGANVQCTVCNLGYYLQPSSTTCNTTCPSSGYYPNYTTHTCSSNNNINTSVNFLNHCL